MTLENIYEKIMSLIFANDIKNDMKYHNIRFKNDIIFIFYINNDMKYI